LLFKASKVATLDEDKLDASSQEWHPKKLLWRWHYGPSTSNFGVNLKPAGHTHFTPRTSIRLPLSSRVHHHHANACQNRESMQDGAISLA
jgi:hypothetical protein